MTAADTAADTPIIPVSWGELIDKITILEIKAERLADAAALANVRRELERLRAVAAPVLADAAMESRIAKLRALNTALWDVEDRIRLKDATGAFDAEFVALARSVYRTNDDRAATKREINVALRSALVEEKSYVGQAPDLHG